MAGKDNAPDLTELYKKMLAEQLAAEKKYQTWFEKLSKLIHTDELRLAISPDETVIESHISRLLSSMQAVQQKVISTLSPIDEELLSALKAAGGKKVSLMKDIQLLEILKMVFSIRVSKYDSLYRMAAVLEHEEYAMLLEQCSKDNQNTYAYLNQISQNVIYPEAKALEMPTD